MRNQDSTQIIPNDWNKREMLREKGQFWTPNWIAEAMVCYVLMGNPDQIFDPAVGAGAFIKATKKISIEMNKEISFCGIEIFENALEEALANGLIKSDLENVEIGDFIGSPPDKKYMAIVANPPYIRHHRMSRELKEKIRSIGLDSIGSPLDGRAGLHVYFLIQALKLLDKNGRLAFIMPSDTVEGKFSDKLWKWITSKFKLEAIITFSPEAAPFPNVDVNAMIFFIKNESPTENFYWAKLHTFDKSVLKRWILSNFHSDFSALQVYDRSISEGLKTGLSRAPNTTQHNGPILINYANVMRGVASGDNSYFLLTRSRASELGIPDEFLKTAIARTRDVNGNVITYETIEYLNNTGRPTLLFCPDGRPIDLFPIQVRKYLQYGEDIGLPNKPLIKQRNPWYKMEKRRIPEFLFAYLGRRNARFIRNLAHVIPLNGFLCVYSNSDDPKFIDSLWEILQDEKTISNLHLIGKTYGQGSIKVEPRALERLPLSQSILGPSASYGIMIQGTLF